MRSSRRERYYNDFPEPVTGYELNPEQGLISVIIPEATTNLVTNPNIEGVTTGYATFVGAMAATYNWQAHGVGGLQLTPAVSTESGFYYGTVALTAATTYTASVTIQGEAGKLYYIWFASTAGALIGTKRSWRGTGHKQRIHVTTVEPTGASRRVYVTRDAQYSDQNLWYADGLQVEAKPYPTTYCDGDQKGFLINESPLPYLWNGTPRASTSSRSAQTRSGGREVNLTMFGFHLLTILGLGMAPLVDQSLPIPGRGELAQGTGTAAREFTLVGSLISDGSRHLSALLDELEDAFKPDLVAKDQPLILRYQAYEDDEPCGDSVDIICKYRGGLEGAVTNHLGERLSLNFKMYLPFIEDTYDNGIELGYSAAVNNADFGVYRDGSGTWHNLSTNFNAAIYCMAKGLDGKIYIGGAFTSFGGDATANYLAYWDGTAIVPLLNITGGNSVNALAVAPNGDIYFGGDFTAVDGDGTISRIGKWDGTSFSSVGGGIASGAVQALAFDRDGKLYIGGTFTNHGDANGDYVTRWDGANYYSIGPADSAVLSIVTDLSNGRVYFGGQFTSFAGFTAYGLMLYYGDFTSGYSAIGGDFLQAGNTIYTMILASDGSLVIGGNLGTGLITATNIARWNGVIWSRMDDEPGNVYALAYKNNLLYIGGNFVSIGDLPLVLGDRLAAFDGTNWIPVDINLPGNPTIYSILVDGDNLFIGFNTSGTAYASTVPVTNAGSALTYPIFLFVGPGTLHQLTNYTSGFNMFFDLTLLAGETAVLDLIPSRIRFTSSFRGNLLNNAILKGSMLNFPILPGSNNLSFFMYENTTGASKIVMYWKQRHWSLNGATWK